MNQRKYFQAIFEIKMRKKWLACGQIQARSWGNQIWIGKGQRV